MDADTKILRLLYIDDLRKLQVCIRIPTGKGVPSTGLTLHVHLILQTATNNVIVRGQDFTANPVTDTRLGKVGR